ncbi:MAG: hypothetical protein AAFV53_35230 [Myxococcota bacterium]
MQIDVLIETWSTILSDPADLYNTSRSVTEALKVLLLAAAIGLALAWKRLPVRVSSRLLIVLVVLTTLNYNRFGPRLLFDKVDTYDLYHYYLNAKYFDELGYYDLYPAAILADHQAGGPHFEEGSRYMAQDPSGHGIRPISHALARGRWVKQNQFTPERWEDFRYDALYLQREIRGFNDKIWRQMIQDHGYNGTPAWTTLARPVARVVPVESIKLLGFIDVALLLVAAGATHWAFGANAAGWLWIMLMTSYSTRWPTISWSYLRYDYLCALIVGMALVKKGRYLLGGVLTGYSASMRLFPAVWLYGPGMKGLFGLVKGTVHRQLLVLLGGFLLSVGTLQAVTLVGLGSEQVKVHFENMVDHNTADQLSSRRIGLALALPYVPGQSVPKYIEPARKKRVEEQKTLRYGLAAVLMLALGWGLRNARDEETYAFGFVPFFLLTTASYYYYVTRATLFIMHAADLSKLRNRVGLSWLLGLELLCFWSEVVYPGHRVFLIGNLAWGLTGYIVLMAVWFIAESLGSSSESAEAQATPQRAGARDADA